MKKRTKGLLTALGAATLCTLGGCFNPASESTATSEDETATSVRFGARRWRSKDWCHSWSPRRYF